MVIQPTTHVTFNLIRLHVTLTPCQSLAEFAHTCLYFFHQLVSYTGGTKYFYGNHAFERELSFAAGDPSMGDASLSIALLSPAHTATYQCKVKKAPGVDMHKMSLVVMGKTRL